MKRCMGILISVQCLVITFLMYTYSTADYRFLEYSIDSFQSSSLSLSLSSSSSQHRQQDQQQASTNHQAAAKKKSQVWNSSKCAVVGLASGYDMHVYEIFVGSLRSTGYNGQIILGIVPTTPPEVLNYLARHHVKTHMVEFDKTYCTDKKNHNPDGKKKCSKVYPDFKIQWGRFLLARDWILECGDDCSDGIMLTDVRDAFFQSDPFQYASQKQMIAPIMLFEEIFPDVTTQHFMLNPVTKCHPDHQWQTKEPMLCSGSTMGTREGILNYITEMALEFDYWKDKLNCHSDISGDDQLIHNYLYYSGELNRYGANKIPHRTGSIHICGVQADSIFRSTIKQAFDSGHGKDMIEAEGWVNDHPYNEIQNQLYHNKNKNRRTDDSTATTTNNNDWHDWLPSHANNHIKDGGLIDANTGYILNLDGMPSPQVHQYDRFAFAFEEFWLKRMKEEVWNNSRR